MSRKIFVWLLATILLTTVSLAEAQQPKKVPRIGFLSAAPSIDPAFLEGLRNLSYTDGKNIVIELRSAPGKLDGLPDLAGELVSLKVEIIVTQGHHAAPPATMATSHITIVIVYRCAPDVT